MMINVRRDETGHEVQICKLATNRRYKEQKLKEIISAICAMLNSNGGKVVVYNECQSRLANLSERLSHLVRILEQTMISIIGVNLTVSNIIFEEKEDCLVSFVKKVDSLITTNYHLYLPSEAQVLQVSPLESIEHVKNIINKRVVLEPIECDSHAKIFIKTQNCGLNESKVCAFKYLKADQSKRTTLADRMTGKSNKFSCYVSAFANFRGGHIYYGITDDGVVEGEVVTYEEDKRDIIKKVGKAISKMIWPEHIGQPKRGEHWDISFQPVIDETSKPIPLTFVIVVSVVACLGGVFTEEPECYEMVEGKVDKMSFITWKERICEPVWLRGRDKIPYSVPRITWSSVMARKTFTDAHKVLMPLINNGNWEAVLKETEILQKKSQLFNMRLPVLSKQITALFRRGRVDKADNLLKEYNEIVTKGEDPIMFEVIGLYLEAALKRARGEETGELNRLIAGALSKAELVEPGVVTATVYVFAGTILNDPMNLDYSSDAFSTRALDCLQYVPDSSKVVDDIRKKAYLTLAASQLGFSINGKRNKENIERSSLNKARDIIMSVYGSVCDGNPLSKYHEIQLNLVQSIYHYRHSQFNLDEQTRLLNDAFNYAKKAEWLAKEKQFPEIVEWSRANAAMCTEELVCIKSRFQTSRRTNRPDEEIVPNENESDKISDEEIVQT